MENDGRPAGSDYARRVTDRPGILAPSRLDPVPVDLRRVILGGTAVWAVALVVTVVLGAVGSLPWTVAWVCVAGIALGGVGLLWARRHPVPDVPDADGPAEGTAVDDGAPPARPDPTPAA